MNLKKNKLCRFALSTVSVWSLTVKVSVLGLVLIKLESMCVCLGLWLCGL